MNLNENEQLEEMKDELPKTKSQLILDKIKANKKVIAVAVAAVFVAGIYAAVGDEEATETGSAQSSEIVDAGNGYQSPDPVMASEIKAQNQEMAKIAEENDTSHIDKVAANTNQNTQVDPFATEPSTQMASAPVASAPVNVINEVGVIKETVIKEVPVYVDNSYQFDKDPTLLALFSNGGVVNGSAGQAQYNIDVNEALMSQKEALRSQKLEGNVAGLGRNTGAYKSNTRVSIDGEEVQPVYQSDGKYIGVGGDNQAKTQQTADSVVDTTPITVRAAGNLEPAILQTAIDSTRPSIVRAQIVSGPLRGAILSGGWSKGGNGGTSVTVTFNSILLKGAKSSLPINAVALDYHQASTALASSVNRHILPRLLTTMVQSAFGRYAQILATNNTTSTTNTGITTGTENNSSTVTNSVTRPKTDKEIAKEVLADGLSQTSEMLSGLVPTEPTVRVRGGVEIGVYFTADFVVPKNVLRTTAVKVPY